MKNKLLTGKELAAILKKDAVKALNDYDMEYLNEVIYMLRAAHYCDTGRVSEASVIMDLMPSLGDLVSEQAYNQLRTTWDVQRIDQF